MHPRTLQDVAKLATQREWVWRGRITAVDVLPGYYWVQIAERTYPIRAASITRAQHYPGDVVLGINAYRNTQLPMILDTISSDRDPEASWLTRGWMDRGRDGTRAANVGIGGWLTRVNLRTLDTQWQISTASSPLVASAEGRLVVGDDIYGRDASLYLGDTDIEAAGVVWMDKWYGGTWESIACIALANGTTRWTNTAASVGSDSSWMSFVYVQYDHSGYGGPRDSRTLIVCAIEPGATTVRLRAINTQTGATVWTTTWTCPGIPRSGREALVHGYLADVVMIAYLDQEIRTTDADLTYYEASIGVPAYNIQIDGGTVGLQAWQIADGEEAWTCNLTPDSDCILDDPADLGRILVSGARVAVVFPALDLPTYTLDFGGGGVYILVDGAWSNVYTWDNVPPGYGGPVYTRGNTDWAFKFDYRQRVVSVDYEAGTVAATDDLDTATLYVRQNEATFSLDASVNYLETESYYALRTGGMECAYLTRDGHITISAPYSVMGTYEEDLTPYPPLTLPTLTGATKTGSATADLYAYCLSTASNLWTYTMAAPDPATQHYTWDMLSYGRNGYAVRCLLTNDVRGQNALTEFGPGYFGTESAPSTWVNLISVLPTTDLVLGEDRMYVVSTANKLRAIL